MRCAREGTERYYDVVGRWGLDQEVGKDIMAKWVGGPKRCVNIEKIMQTFGKTRDRIVLAR